MLKSARGLLTLVAIFAGSLAFASSGSAAKAQSKESPLLALGGTWSGQGTINFNDGTKERIRCRSTYTPDGTGAKLKLELRCASDSYKFELNSNVAYDNGQISGNWSEASRNAAGDISGTATAGHIDVRAVGQTFAAFLNINTRGSSQSVSIKSPGSTMQEVQITLAKQ